MVDMWSDEYISDCVAKSSNLRQVLRLMGLKDGGMSRKKLKDRIAELNLSVAHFKLERDKNSVWHDEDRVRHAVETSLSLADTVRNMGQTISGSSYAAAKRAIKRFGLSTDHFNVQESVAISRRSMVVINGRVPLESVLTENSTFNKSSLRSRLIKERVIPYKCRCCGNIGWWMDKPLSLQLEHINGNSTDNRKENLEFLCPNCHTQTPTWGRKCRTK